MQWGEPTAVGRSARRFLSLGLALSCSVALSADAAFSQHRGADHGGAVHGGAHEEGERGPYAGLQERAVASLSEEDVAQIRRGDGWGFALPAELNGYPGPRHVLDLAEALGLDASQRAAVEAIFDEMRAEATAAGERFIAAEAALSNAFRSGAVDAERLRALVDAAAIARADLRYIHLARHLAMMEILSDDQVRRYALLRGYAADPCATPPAGHDPAMWRRHNNCG